MIGRRGKQTLLNRLHNNKCRKCILRKSSEHVCILGRGNVMAKVILLGEAPGENEANTGKIFSGRSGKLLDECIAEAKMTGRVWIINAVCCHPPGNRNPKAPELKACSKYLAGQLKIIQPKAIVLLGRVAATSLGFDKKNMKVSTVVHCYHAWFRSNVRMTYHPSYYLRGYNKYVKQNIIDALKWAKLFDNDEEI